MPKPKPDELWPVLKTDNGQKSVLIIEGKNLQGVLKDGVQVKLKQDLTVGGTRELPFEVTDIDILKYKKVLKVTLRSLNPFDDWHDGAESTDELEVTITNAENEESEPFDEPDVPTVPN